MKKFNENDGAGSDLTGGAASSPSAEDTASSPSFSEFEFAEGQIETLGLTEEQKTSFTNKEEFKLSDEQQTKFDQILDDKKATDGNESGAPDTYAEFKMLDGITVDSELLDTFTPLFKSKGMTQEEAQEQINLYSKVIKEREQSAQKTYEDGVAKWEADTKADKTLGGDNFNETKRLSSLAVQKLGTPELSTFLMKYGIGNQPELVRLLVQAGKLVDEDGPGRGSVTANVKSRSDILYPVKED